MLPGQSIKWRDRILRNSRIQASHRDRVSEMPNQNSFETGTGDTRLISIGPLIDGTGLPPSKPWLSTRRNVSAEAVAISSVAEDRRSIDSDPSLGSFEQTVQNLSSMFCRQCFMYGCQIHTALSSPIVHRSRRPVQKQPCSEGCYMNEIAIVFVKGENSKSQAFSDEWSEDEKSRFTFFYELDAGNYCAIASALGTKTCRQVQEYVEREKPELAAASSWVELSGKRKRYKISGGFGQCKKVAAGQDDQGGLIFGTGKTYRPCSHEGPCGKSNPSCACADRPFCEKFCQCAADCQMRYPGCGCRDGRCNTGLCRCKKANRECDPDICDSCGASDIESAEPNCRNISIQRFWKKHLLLAPSEVAGWGIFIKESAKKDELISEYCGEVISEAEAEKRGELYDKQEQSFLFDLNEDSVVDGTRTGNKIRFANHSSINDNCYARVKMVNGDHRIGIYAKRNIEPGEELLFDYKAGGGSLSFDPVEWDQ